MPTPTHPTPLLLASHHGPSARGNDKGGSRHHHGQIGVITIREISDPPWEAGGREYINRGEGCEAGL